MLSERIRHVPLLTFHETMKLFEAAASQLPECFSLYQLEKAYEWEFVSALAAAVRKHGVERFALSVTPPARDHNGDKFVPPWVKVDPHKMSNTTE